MADVDTSEVMALARDLAGAPRRVHKEAQRVMKRSALGVKRTMQGDFTGHRYSRGVPFSLEMRSVPGTNLLAWDIGELNSAGRQWGIAAILAYGTSNNAPVVDHTASLYREVPLVEHYLGEAGADSMLGGPE